jgi:hypothetical protein
MSHEVPEHLDELSRHALREAITKVDEALAGAPEDVRRAIAVIKLVTGMPRRCPWYGVPMDPEDSSVTVGVVLANLLGVYWGSEGQRQELLRGLEAGKRDYHDYLDHLLDPERWAAESAEPGLSPAQAASAYLAATNYLARNQ